LRLGTREQYESQWRSIGGTASYSFTHELGEIPWVVDVLRSDHDDGTGAIVAPTVTISKTDRTITITNDAGTGYYFKVRAM
jgi:hypothetical protein